MAHAGMLWCVDRVVKYRDVRAGMMVDLADCITADRAAAALTALGIRRWESISRNKSKDLADWVH